MKNRLTAALVCALVWSLLLSLVSIAIHSYLPYWLGGSAEIAHDASLYFMLIGICGIFFQMEGLAASMLNQIPVMTLLARFMPEKQTMPT